jgi:hypothetical protein
VDPDQGEPNQSESETRFEHCVSDPNAEQLGNRWVPKIKYEQLLTETRSGRLLLPAFPAKKTPKS